MALVEGVKGIEVKTMIRHVSTAAGGLLLAASTLQSLSIMPSFGAPIPEPNAIYYGHVYRNNTPQTGVTVTLKAGSVTLDQYTTGSNPAAGTLYVLGAQLFSPLAPGDQRPPAAVFIGDNVSIFISGDITPRQQFQITDRGVVTQFDISADGTPVPTFTSTPPTNFTPSPPINTPTPNRTQTPNRTVTPNPASTSTRTTTSTPRPTNSPTPTAAQTPTPTPTATSTPTVPKGSGVLAANIDANLTTIPVADVSEFPDAGFIQIDDELLHFDGKTITSTGPFSDASDAGGTAPGTLDNVVRGLGGTVAAPHSAGAQVTLVAVSSCVGDCGDDQAVTVDELLVMVNIALGSRPVSDCIAGDGTLDGTVTVNEILKAVNNSLNGCP